MKPRHQKSRFTSEGGYFIPIFLHGGSGYDFHLILKQFSKRFTEDEIEVIPSNTEKFIGFTIGNFRFLDSCKFLTASLDSLTQNLIKSGKDKFRHTKAEFGDSDLVFRKGVYCYEYMKGPEQFLETELPPREAFYSQLNEHELSADDYKVAEETWNTFECKTLKDYHDFYLKLDVTLLADIFENFRAVARSTYGLDPAHYWSLPGYSWDACLKQTKVELELLTEKDAQMYLFIESAIRSGVSMIAH